MSELFSRILVSLDDTAPSRAAAAYAARLAREHHSEVILCHVVNWLPLIAELESSGAIVDPDPTIARMQRRGETLLAEAAIRIGPLTREPVLRVLDGEPAQALVRLAVDARCTLIVMGTHGRRGIGRLLVGSTTELVLRASPIPVLTIREGMGAEPTAEHGIERVLVAVDDSEPAAAAVDAALALPAEARDSLLFCTVVDTDSFVGGRSRYDRDTHARLCADAHALLGRIAARASARGIAVQTHVAQGSPAAALIAAARRHRADLIVMGSHGRRGMQRFFLGSVAENAVRTSPIPVLVVRSGPGSGANADAFGERGSALTVGGA